MPMNKIDASSTLVPRSCRLQTLSLLSNARARHRVSICLADCATSAFLSSQGSLRSLCFVVWCGPEFSLPLLVCQAPLATNKDIHVANQHSDLTGPQLVARLNLQESTFARPSFVHVAVWV